MQPTASDVHVNAPLTMMSLAMMQSADDFIATRVFPVIPVSKQSDRYYVYDRGTFNTDEMAERAPATESAGSGYSLDSTPTYYCREFALHKDIPDQVRGNADDALNPDREAIAWLTNKALIKREKLFTNSYFKAGVWTNNITGVVSGPTGGQVLQWNDAASNPIEDVRRWRRTIRESTGIEANTGVIGRPVYDALADHPDVIDRVKYGQTQGGPALGTLAALRQLLEIDRLFVMNAVENTAKEGQAATHAFIGGKGMLLCHAAPTPGLMTPSGGYTFAWNGAYGATGDGTRIRRLRMEPIKADRVEIEMCVDPKLIGADLGLFSASLVA